MRIEHESSAVDGSEVRFQDPGPQAQSSPVQSWPEPFRVEVRTARDRALIAPIGELDLATASPLHDFLVELEDSGFDCLVLDLRRLSFMDCSGLRTVLQADARARQAGRQLEVVCVPGQVRRLLALTGAGQQLDVVELPVVTGAGAMINGVAA